MSSYLFVLCPPFCGSTVLWHLLATSPHVSALPDEGQFLKGVRRIMRNRPWDQNQQMPWPLIKKRWEESWDMTKPILLEKSPPNLVRAAEIQKHFEPCHFIAMIRNPYAFCEGFLRRQGRGAQFAAVTWIERAQQQIDNIDRLDRITHFTYEALTGDPPRIAQQILDFLPSLESLDCERSFKAKSVEGRKARPLVNMNAGKIARLTVKETQQIDSVLDKHEAIMSFFGYERLDPQRDLAPRTFQDNVRINAARATNWFKRLPKKVRIGHLFR